MRLPYALDSIRLIVLGSESTAGFNPSGMLVKYGEKSDKDLKKGPNFPFPLPMETIDFTLMLIISKPSCQNTVYSS